MESNHRWQIQGLSPYRLAMPQQMAGEERIGLSMSVLETAVMPFNYSPTTIFL